MEMLSIQLAAFQALLLAASAVHKFAARERSRAAAHDFAGVPRRVAPMAVGIIALAELAAAVLLWIPAWRAAGAMLAALIWGGYLSLILRAIAQGRRDVDCGCSFGASSRRLGAYHLARNALLLGVALDIGALSANGGGPVLAAQAFAAVALLALYGALDQVMVLRPLRFGESS